MICRLDFTLNDIEFSHQFTKTLKQIKNSINDYDVEQVVNLSFSKILTLSLRILEEKLHVDTEIIERIINNSILIILSQNLIDEHDENSFFVHMLWENNTFVFVRINHQFEDENVVDVVEFLLIFIDFLEFC